MRKHARIPFALCLSIAFAVAAFADEQYTITKLPVKTLRELAAQPDTPLLPRETRHDDRGRRVHRDAELHVRTNAMKAIEANATTIAAPPILASFPTDTSANYSPADASGAVSKTHLVSTSNVGIVVKTRGGVSLAQLTLGKFWRNVDSNAEYYDPRVAYDEAVDRWVMAAIRDEYQLVLAASQTGDPLGAWNRYTLDLDGCDFTRLALTKDTILLSTTLPDYGVLFSFRKSEVYNGRANLTVTSYPTLWDAVPVHAPDDAVEYIVILGDSRIHYKHPTNPDGTWTIVLSDFSWDFPISSLAPQANTTKQLDMGYGEIEAAEYRNGFIYAVHRIGRSARTNDNNALMWWKVDPTGTRAAEYGIIDSTTDVYAYPSLAVNRKGEMLLSFSKFSSSTYPSASYVFRDALGRMSEPASIRNGDSPILTTDRWGDYTTVVSDPASDRGFWVMQIAATAGNWQTWWANVQVPLGKTRAVRK